MLWKFSGRNCETVRRRWSALSSFSFLFLFLGGDGPQLPLALLKAEVSKFQLRATLLFTFSLLGPAHCRKWVQLPTGL